MRKLLVTMLAAAAFGASAGTASAEAGYDVCRTEIVDAVARALFAEPGGSP